MVQRFLIINGVDTVDQQNDKGRQQRRIIFQLEKDFLKNVGIRDNKKVSQQIKKQQQKRVGSGAHYFYLHITTP